MKDFNSEGLTITCRKAGNKVTMTWIGQSDARNPDSLLTPYLNSFLEELTGNNLVIKYHALKFMNSSSVKVILQFITSLNKNGVDTLVSYNKASTWQQNTFKALKIYCGRMEHIRVQGDFDQQEQPVFS